MSLSSMIVSRDWQEVSVLECILSGLHIEVDVEPELERAWIRLRKSKIDALIVDCDTLGTRSFLRKLRMTSQGPSPIVIASGSPSVTGLRGTGATFVVEKPVSVEQAVHTLSAARNMILNERLRYYREVLDLPAWVIRDSGEKMRARVMNVSKGGTKIISDQPLSFSEAIKLTFSLPKVTASIQAAGQVAWADRQGNAGIRFMQIEPQVQKQLQLWVEQRFFQSRTII